MNAEKLSAILESHDRCVITGSLNCAIVFYAFCEPNEICFISDPASVHAAVLAEGANTAAQTYKSDKLNHAALIKQIAPISVAIYEDERWCGLCAQARLIPTSSDHKKRFFASYPAARLAINHEIYALQICWAKYKDLKGLKRWEYYHEKAFNHIDF